MARIAVGGFQHETNTFAPQQATWEEFVRADAWPPLLRGPEKTELSQFWPYVFGAEGARDPEVTATYSDLMAQSQTLVAEDTLRLVDFSKVRRLMDVGGGTGAFLTAVGQACNGPQLDLFDLPVVVGGATARFAKAGLSTRCTIHPGSFRDDPLPRGWWPGGGSVSASQPAAIGMTVRGAGAFPSSASSSTTRGGASSGSSSKARSPSSTGAPVVLRVWKG